jgi:hypothetical protein
MGNTPLTSSTRPQIGPRHAPGSTPNQQTLRLSAPFGQTLALAGAILLLLIATSEAALRLPAVQERLSAPSLGNRHRLLEIQLHHLRAFARQEGHVHCIVLGNSMVWLDFDPSAFARAYREATGQDMRCYNFGIDGLPASAAGALAEIVVREFRPAVLIYGTDARDYAVPRDAPDAVAILDMPWLRYRHGDFSPEGWLYDHSYLYGYRLHLRHLLRFNYTSALPRPSEVQMAARHGFAAYETVGSFVASPPDPGDQSGQLPAYFSLLRDYQLRPDNLAGLAGVLQQVRWTRLVVTAMPVPITYYAFFGNGRHD